MHASMIVGQFNPDLPEGVNLKITTRLAASTDSCFVQRNVR